MRKQGMITLLICAVWIAGCCRDAEMTRLPPEPFDGNAELREQWGIEVCGIRLSAEGYMLDFRYRVVDAEKAKPLLERQAECYLVDEKTGSRLIIPAPPKVGSLRNTAAEPVEGKIYYMMFANPGRLISYNDKVTVSIQDLKISGMSVQ